MLNSKLTPVNLRFYEGRLWWYSSDIYMLVVENL